MSTNRPESRPWLCHAICRSLLEPQTFLSVLNTLVGVFLLPLKDLGEMLRFQYHLSSFKLLKESLKFQSINSF